MAGHRVIFEFVYDYGAERGVHHRGSLDDGDFARLVRGTLSPMVEIEDVATWDAGRDAFVANPQLSGSPAGTPCFQRDRIRRVWAVDAAKLPALKQEPKARPEKLQRVLEDFFGASLLAPRIVTETISESELPNLCLAIEDLVKSEGKQHRVLGVAVDAHRGHGLCLRAILSPSPFGEPYEAGPPEWKRLPIDIGKHNDCLTLGLQLLELNAGKVVLATWMNRFNPEAGYTFEVMSADHDVASRVLDSLRETMVRLNVYRGKVISFKPQKRGCGYEIEFRRLEVPHREEIVLPKDLFELVERNALGVRLHADRLRAANRSLRRGLLLHGKPGTGKTLTVRYLCGQLPGHTIILLTGPSLGLIQQACSLARALSPSVVILEDVDLIARERVHNEHARLLHDLLDEMDGLSPKLEMLFVLTTNRPEILEPALAARPGRVDQAIEFPLPDREGRARLFELYSRGIPIAADLESFIDRTQGASGAFISELLRRALLFAAQEGSQEVLVPHMESALRELCLAGGNLTRSLLGFEG